MINRRSSAIALLAGVLVISGCQHALVSAAGAPSLSRSAAAVATNKVPLAASRFGKQAAFVPGEVIVKFKTGTDISRSTRRFGLDSTRALAGDSNAVVATTSGDVQGTVNRLKADPAVAYAEPNYIIRVSQTAAAPVNDPDWKKQYAPAKVQAPEAWKLHAGSPGVTIAIVDTGIDANHPDLKDKVLPGFDVIDGDTNPNDGQGHGTHCAGIAAASVNNGIGIAGIAAKNKVFAVRVLDDEGSGTIADVATGIIKAADMGAKVISMSLGGSESAKVLEDAIVYAQKKDALVIAAMGNDGQQVKSYPAAVPGVLAVGSTDAADKRSSFSNFGPWISVSAPGSNIWSTLPSGGSPLGNKYGNLSGTSMATPAVAGLAALVRSAFPAMTAAQVRARIEKAADDVGSKGFDVQFGHGRINALKALTP
jgi:thermitase